jgi:diguanylate cyclase (GGDEF)-like protein
VEDLFARYGGEEFVVLCRGTDLDKAAILGERLRELIASSVIMFQGARIPVTISVGVASHVDQPNAEMQLIAAADRALYESKHAGRNRVTKASKPR